MINIRDYYILAEYKTRYSLSSGVICSYKLVQRWSSWWVNLISSRRRTKTSNCSRNTFGNWPFLRCGTTSAQMTSLPTWKCYRWIKQLWIFNIAQKLLIWISSRPFWCIFTELPSYRCEADHWKGATTLLNVTTSACDALVSRIMLPADGIKFFRQYFASASVLQEQRLPFLNPVIKNKLMTLLQIPETTLWKILVLQRCHIFFGGWICLSKHSMTYFHVIFVIKLICVL